MMYPRPLVLITFLLASGCGGEPLDIAQRADRLVNGTTHNGHPAVGALMANGGLCTATLVGTKTVLTAAHCVEVGGQHRFFLENKFWSVTSVARHPSYDPQRAENDVAVVKLESKPPVTPASITTVPPVKGQELTILGFGATTHSGAGSGTKRIGTNRVASVTSTRILISGSSGSDANLCFGDSGGPSFATIDGNEVQVGVHSTISGTCGQQGHDMRVDVFADWIRDAAGGDVAEDGKPSPLDDQKAPMVKITSPARGAQLRGAVEVTAEVSDDNAVAEVALVVEGKIVSTLSAPPFRFSLALDPGKHGLTVVGRDLAGNQGEAKTEIEVLPPLRFGEVCSRSDECSTGLCGAAGGDSFCTQSCTPQAGCPDDALCLPAGGDSYACGEPGSALDGGGGCVVTPGAPGPRGASLLLLLALGVLIAARPRRGG
jgi:hypothetical protein